MHVRWFVATAFAVLLVPAPARTQQGVPGGPPGGGRAQAAQAMRERRQAMAERLRNMTPEERQAARDRMKARLDSLTPAQRDALKERRAAGRSPVDPAYAQARRDELKSLRDQVKAGTLDRHAAAEQMREWLKTHRPAAPGNGG
jgi:hypothetical protein